MSQKLEFVERAANGEKVADLCREFGVSRQTGHKWIKRYEQGGYDALEERSRRPKSAPLATAEELVLATLQEREAHPRLPLRRHGAARKSRRQQPCPHDAPLVTMAPNDLASADVPAHQHRNRCERFRFGNLERTGEPQGLDRAGARSGRRHDARIDGKGCGGTRRARDFCPAL